MSNKLIQLATLLENHRKEVTIMQNELDDLRAYKSLSIELANRKGFDSVAHAIEVMSDENKVMYELLCETWPRTNKPLEQVINERVDNLK